MPLQRHSRIVVGIPVYNEERFMLDLKLQYTINRRYDVFLDVNNLTDEPQISYQGFRRTDNPEDITTYSWRATFGATYKF